VYFVGRNGALSTTLDINNILADFFGPPDTAVATTRLQQVNPQEADPKAADSAQLDGNPYPWQS